MAQINITTDTNYSSLTIADGDNIVIGNFATLTIDTNTVNLSSISYNSSTGGGTLNITNSSTTTPVFINFAGPASGSTSALIDVAGAPYASLVVSGSAIPIGVGDGVTTTYALPQGSSSSKFSSLGVCWVNHGDMFRDGTSYKRTYCEIDTFVDMVSSYTDFFTHDFANNSITFRNPPPVGAQITIPNIQLRRTAGFYALKFAGKVSINYASIYDFDNLNMNGLVLPFTFNNSSYHNGGYPGATHPKYVTGRLTSSNCRRMTGTMDFLNSTFRVEYSSFDYALAAKKVTFKNSIVTAKPFYLNGGAGISFSQVVDGYFEKVLFANISNRYDADAFAINVSTANALTNGQWYYIRSLGTTTTAEWQSLGYKGTPVVGGTFLSASIRSTNGTGVVSLALERLNDNANISLDVNFYDSKLAGYSPSFGRNGITFENVETSPKFYYNQFRTSNANAFTVNTALGNFLFNNISTINDNNIGSWYTLFYGSETSFNKTFNNCTIRTGEGSAINVNSNNLRVGNLYWIKALGTTTTAEWQAIGYSGTPAVNGTFTATGIGTNGSGTVALAPMFGIVQLERGSTRFNNVNITGKLRSRAFPFDGDTANLVYKNIISTENSIAATAGTDGNYTFSSFLDIERMLIEHATPNSNFGLSFLGVPKDCNSLLLYTNTNKTTGRCFMFPCVQTTSTTQTLGNNANQLFVYDGYSNYLKTNGDSVTVLSKEYGGVTGINTFLFRDNSNASLTPTTFDSGYTYYVSMRRPNGTYTTPRRMMGVRLVGSNQTANYSVGNVVTQVRTINSQSVTLSGVVESITSSEIRINNITCSDNSLWPVFVQTSVSNNPIINVTTGYTPTTNPYTSQDEYVSTQTLNDLKSDFSNLAANSENKVQFKITTVRSEKSGETNTYSSTFNFQALDLQLDPNYSAEFLTMPATISAPEIVSGSRVRLYNLTKSIELVNEILTSKGISKQYDLLGSLVSVGDIIEMRATYQNGLTAKLPLKILGVVSTGGVSFADSQEDDAIYISNNINGSAITGITLTPDYTNIQIDLSDNTPPYEITAQQVYNYFCYIITTEQGIRNFYGAITPIDRMNYQINSSVVALKIQNTGSTDVIINGGRLFRDDNISIIDTGVGAGSGSLMHDTGFLLQYIQPQVDAAVGNLAQDADMQTVKTDVAKIKKNASLIPALL